MTNKKNYRGPVMVSAIIVLTAIVLSSWDFAPFRPDQKSGDRLTHDTIPKKETREKKIRDLDDVLEELNRADFKMDMEKMQAELNKAMKNLDTEKLKIDIEKSMKQPDMEKLQKDIDQSIAKAMKDIDAAKLQMEIQESMEKINWDKIKTDLERVKEIDMQKMEADMKKMEKELSKIGPEIEKSMEKARVEIEKAKVEMKAFNDFVDGLEKDGLLNRAKGYTIKHSNGELFINDKKASEATYKKYRSFLEKHKKFTIEKSDDDFNIDID